MARKRYQRPVSLEDPAEQAIVELVRLGLERDTTSISQLARQLLRRQSSTDRSPAFREALGSLLVGRNDAVRAAQRSMPVEPESQLPLALIEGDPRGPVPILRSSEQAQIDALIEQREQARQLLDAGLEPPKTLLLSGPPGVGKTMTARFLAHNLGLPLLTVELAALMSSLLGKTGQNLRQLLDHARAMPCVLLLDEFDAVAKRRDDQTDIGELKRLVNVLLLELERWPASGLLVAATNHPHLLDPAVGRRFDLSISLTLPAQRERRAMLDATLSRLGLGADARITDACALALEGASGADIERLVSAAARQAVLAGTPVETSLADLALASLRTEGDLDLERRSAFCALATSQLGMTQRAVADLLGISHPTVAKLARRWHAESAPDLASREKLPVPG
ncbi:MAG: ATP-binding protein [Actinobacteria bacterium]|nr:ATP-binding protein [Actinomycetota bacterium]